MRPGPCRLATRPQSRYGISGVVWSVAAFLTARPTDGCPALSMRSQSLGRQETSLNVQSTRGVRRSSTEASGQRSLGCALSEGAFVLGGVKSIPPSELWHGRKKGHGVAVAPSQSCSSLLLFGRKCQPLSWRRDGTKRRLIAAKQVPH